MTTVEEAVETGASNPNDGGSQHSPGDHTVSQNESSGVEPALTKEQSDRQALKAAIKQGIEAANQVATQAEEPEAPETAPVEEGEGGEEGEETSEEEASEGSEGEEAEYLHLDDFGDDLVPFKADGEERLVPLSELVQLAQKGINYESKSSALGEERKDLEALADLGRSFRRDPERFIREYQQAVGRTVSEREPESYGYDDYYGSSEQEPADRDYAKLAKEVESLKREKRLEAFWQRTDAAIDTLETEVGEKIDRKALKDFMAERRIPDPADAYAILNFKQAKETATKLTKQGEKTARRKARTATRVHRRGNTPAQTGSAKPGELSIRDAAKEALRQYREEVEGR